MDSCDRVIRTAVRDWNLRAFESSLHLQKMSGGLKGDDQTDEALKAEYDAMLSQFSQPTGDAPGYAPT